MKQKIIGTGLSGMVGSRIVELLGDTYEFEDLSLKSGVDIKKKEIVDKKIGHSKAQVVLHLAAKTDVDLCEKDKSLGEKGDAWQVNVLGTKNIADACKSFNKKMIYISTDFVFDGRKSSTEGYVEGDTPSPLNWYGITKYEGEKITQKLGKMAIICRIAYPFRAKFPQKLDFVRAIIDKFKKREEIFTPMDHIFTPTFIDDIVLAINNLMKKEKSGLYHVVGSQSLTPYQAVNIIAEEFNFNKSVIKPVKMSSYFEGRASRPKNLYLKNDKIQKLGVKMRSFEQGIKEIKKQISKIKELV